MEAPTATYLPSNTADPNLPGPLVFIGNLACFLSGSVLAFDDETLAALYPDHGAYVSQVTGAANALKAQRLLLQSDAQKVKQAAAQSGIGE
jgi:hypothetical protein